MVAANGRDDRLAQHWAEWADLVVAETASLDSCGDVAWGVVGDTLARLPDPLGTWRSAAKRLQPLLRRRARHGAWEHGEVVFPFVMSGVNGAARLGEAGRELWLEVFAFALRHFFVDQPPDNHRSFNLPAYVFGACPTVFSDDTQIEALLDRLPSPAHVTCARKQVAANAVAHVELGNVSGAGPVKK